MIRQWFDSRQASETGTALADRLSPSAAGIVTPGAGPSAPALQKLLGLAVEEVRDLTLNIYQRAKLANAFRWKLIENGVDKRVADEVTQALVVNITSTSRRSEAFVPDQSRAATISKKPQSGAKLLARGNKSFSQGDFSGALALYAELLKVDPQHAEALNNVGSALFRLGRYIEAEQHYRGAIKIRPAYPDALMNLGNVLRRRGYFSEAVESLRRAVKLRPNYWDAHCDLGSALVFVGDLRGARARYKKVLKAKSRHIGSLLGMAHIAAIEGRMEEAGKLFDRVMEIDTRNPTALAARTNLRKQTLADAAWLHAAEELAASGIDPYEEAMLRSAIGKYFDDVGNFARAFESHQHANEILKPSAEPYDRKKHTQMVRSLIQAYSRGVVAQSAKEASTSTIPVFLVGMPRSGASLVEQIICSHPSAKSAGELPFWFDATRVHAAEFRDGLTEESLIKGLRDSYLRALEPYAESALRVVDKAPLNSDHLGAIHKVFPHARIIYMQRDPIDTCLSCFFHMFPLTANFTLSLSDLAHYYEEHKRLMDHWRSVLPAGTILDVPYSELVSDQEGWARRILDFVGLQWDERCLSFEQTERAEATVSYKRVRRKIYNTSVARWRNYAKYIGPLRILSED